MKALKNSWYYHLAGILALSFILAFMPVDTDHYESNRSFANCFTVSLIFTSVFWTGNMLIVVLYREKLPEYSQTRKRLLFTFFTCLTFIIAVDYPLVMIASSAADFKSGVSFLERLTQRVPINIAISGFVTAVYESTYFMARWKESLIEAEHLKLAQVRSQLQVLKDQVSPHFLFNSLNTLMSLIPEDPNLALSFTDKLAQVYRYILQQREHELVPLTTELRFVESYVFLQQIRFGDSLQMEIHLEPKLIEHAYTVPLSLQMLVENAIKHNVVSAAKPLHIQLQTNGKGSLLIRNNYQPKPFPQPGTNTGLENLRQQFRYLSNREIEILITPAYFEVILPLIYLESATKAHFKAPQAVSVNHLL